MDDYRLPVDDGLAFELAGVGNHGKAFRPTMAVTGVVLHLAAVDMDLRAVAIEFDFVNPLLARRSLAEADAA